MSYRMWAKKRTEEALRDPRSTNELIKLALTSREQDDAGDKALMLLRYRGNQEVLDAARALCKSNKWQERELGAQILGMLGVLERTYPEESLRTILQLLQVEQDSEVLSAIGHALNNLHDPRGVEPLSKLKDHPHEDVRFGVVLGVGGQLDDLAIDTLIELSEDVDDDVRDWATFGLGQQLNIYAEDEPFFTPERVKRVCDALYKRITDLHDDTRSEAIIGLALWKDERVVEPLIHELSQSSISIMTLEAATAISDARLCPSLFELQQRWKDDEPDKFSAELEQAIASCGCETGGETNLSDK